MLFTCFMMFCASNVVVGRNFVPVICGNLYPDHSTCAAFVRRHAAAVAGLLPESVRACAREGLVSLEVTAGDGTKLKANASMASNVTAGQLQAQIAEPEAFIGAGVEGVDRPDPGRRAGRPGPGTRGHGSHRRHDEKDAEAGTADAGTAEGRPRATGRPAGPGTGKPEARRPAANLG